MQALSADWIFPVSSPPLFQHTLEFDGGVVHSIRPSRPGDPRMENACILPGLVNAHTHLAYTALRNQLDHLSFFPWIRRLTELKMTTLRPEDLALSARMGILECLRAGITTVADMSDSAPALAELSRSPLRGIFYWEVFGVEREHADRSWDELHAIFPRLQQEYATGRLRIGVSPHACFTVRPELYSRIASWALQESIAVSFHAAESREEEAFISRREGVIAKFLEQRASDWKILGPSSVAHLAGTGIFETRPLVAHLVQASESDIEILQRNDVRVAHCPKSNAKFGHGIAPLSAFFKAGLQVGLGTDSAASNNRLDLFEEGRFALLQQRTRDGAMVSSEERILELMTLGGARAMGMEHEVGSLEPQKMADFVILKIPPVYSTAEQVLRHIVHNTTSQDVMETWIQGQRVSTEESTREIQELYQRCSIPRE